MSRPLHQGSWIRRSTSALYTLVDPTNCTTWLKSESLTSLGNGNPIGSWADSSAAGASWTQSGAARPTCMTGGQNGKTYALCNGSSTYLGGPTLSSLITTTTDTIIVVFSFISASSALSAGAYYGNNCVFSDLGGYRTIVVGTGAIGTSVYTASEADLSVSKSTGSVYLIATQHGSGNLSAQNHSTAFGSSPITAGNVGSLAGATMLGYRSGAGTYANVGIYEVMTWKTTITAPLRASTISYLVSKYAITT